MASVASWLVYYGVRDMAGRAGLDNMMEKCDREAHALDQAVVMVSQNPKHAKYKETTSELIKAGHMKLLFNDTPQLQLV